MNNRYRPNHHDLVGIEVVPDNRRDNWFVRISYTGDPVREFRGERCETRRFDTEHGAREFAAIVE